MDFGRRRLICSVLAVAAPGFGSGPVLAEPAGFDRPRTLMALLQNMKRAAQEQRLRDEAFYAEDNLKQAFGAANVSFGSRVEGYRVHGKVWGFGVLATTVRTGAGAREGIDFSFHLSAREGALNLVFLEPTMPFDKIEGTFGTGWKQGTYIAPAGAVEPYALRHRGSSAILYPLGTEAAPASLTFSFNPRAVLEAVSAVAH